MCLILFSWKENKRYPLIVAANRDEFYDRPTQAAHYWKDSPQILAGRDLKGMGTWMGLTVSGRFAALTNYRDGLEEPLPNAPSRGDLVADFLKGELGPEAYLRHLSKRGKDYNGFNLLVSDGHTLWYYSNRSVQPPKKLPAGTYGLSNHLLNTSWFKVSRGRELFKEQLNSQQHLHPRPFLDLLSDTERPADEELPSTGVPLKWERLLSSMFIKSPSYGTRCSTVIIKNEERKEFMLCERKYDQGMVSGEEIWSFQIQ